MKRVYLSGVVLAGLTVTLCGCSTTNKINFFKKQDTQYLMSTTKPPLQVPAGLNSTGVGDDYLIPAAVNTAPVQQPNLLPPDSMADKLARGVITKDDLKRADKFAKAKSPTPVVVPLSTSTMASTPNKTTALPQGISLAGDIPVLSLTQNSTQAWNTVGKGLKRAGYKIALEDEKVHSYYILDVFATQGKITKTTPIYQVKLEDSSAGNGYAYVVDQMGGPVNRSTAETILQKLNDGIAGKGPSFISEVFAPVKRWFTEAF